MAVLLHVHFGSMLSWVIAEAMNLSYFQLTRMMWALFHFGVLYNTGRLNYMVPWGSTSTVFQLHWRKILLYFSQSFQKQVVLWAVELMKPVFQCHCDPTFVSYSHLLWHLIKLKLLFKCFTVSGTPNVYFREDLLVLRKE